MSTVPEVILARFLGLRVAAISTITNMAAGMSAEEMATLSRLLAGMTERLQQAGGSPPEAD